jgi:phosphatidylcholine synthase
MQIAAWLVHLYTASGVVLAFLATCAVFAQDYRAAFICLYLQVVIDATDGTFARRAQVAQRLPGFNGAKLDDIVDYLTYVFVPALIVWRAALVPDGWTLIVVSAMLLSSAIGFNKEKAKTTDLSRAAESRDHFFTGFPSYWNIVVFYLMVAGWSGAMNAAFLAALAVFVFVPIRYVYPSRTVAWRSMTMVLGILWGVLLVVMLWDYPEVPRSVFWASLVYPAYYVALSLYLQFGVRHR